MLKYDLDNNVVPNLNLEEARDVCRYADEIDAAYMVWDCEHGCEIICIYDDVDDSNVFTVFLF